MKRLVFQTWTNLNGTEMPDWAAQCHRRAAQYAHRVNADYELHTPTRPRNFNSYLFNKYHAIERLKFYDQVLYLDSDVWVNHTARDIFEIHEHSGLVGVHQNSVDRQLYTDNSSQGAINSGVLLFNLRCAERFSGRSTNLDISSSLHNTPSLELNPSLRKHLGIPWYALWDQRFSEWVTYNTHAHPRLANDEPLFWHIIWFHTVCPFHLDRTWNHRVLLCKTDPEQADFVHYCGGITKTQFTHSA